MGRPTELAFPLDAPTDSGLSDAQLETAIALIEQAVRKWLDGGAPVDLHQPQSASVTD